MQHLDPFRRISVGVLAADLCCPSVSMCQHKVQIPGVIFILFAAFPSLAPANVQIVNPLAKGEEGISPPVQLTPASGLQKSLSSCKAGRG